MDDRPLQIIDDPEVVKRLDDLLSAGLVRRVPPRDGVPGYGLTTSGLIQLADLLYLAGVQTQNDAAEIVTRDRLPLELLQATKWLNQQVLITKAALRRYAEALAAEAAGERSP